VAVGRASLPVIAYDLRRRNDAPYLLLEEDWILLDHFPGTDQVHIDAGSNGSGAVQGHRVNVSKAIRVSAKLVTGAPDGPNVLVNSFRSGLDYL